jgi:hypothetical protein
VVLLVLNIAIRLMVSAQRQAQEQQHGTGFAGSDL